MSNKTPDARKLVGRKGEELAIRHLKRQGLKVIERNYHSPGGEIDLIARDGDTLVFIEIKARSSAAFGLPQEAVDTHKQKRLIEAARVYMAEHRLGDNVKARFDVVAVHLGQPALSISWIRDAFQVS